jgi:hypothetical protein
MYRDTSNVSGDLSEALVYADLIRRGWIVLAPSSRDSVYDFVVDLGNNIFQTIQVKTMCGNSIAKVIDRSGERVSANGKARNSLDYAEHGVHWLVGVRKSDNKIFYYTLDKYSKISTKSFSVNRHDPDDFPINNVPSRHSKKTA